MTDPTVESTLLLAALRAHVAPVDGGAARLFRMSDETQRRALVGLVREASGLAVHDTYRLQLGELLETRQPAKRFAPGELEAEVVRALDGRTPELLGTWVHYPWSRRLVHLLDEAEFVELRTSRNRYKITGPEQARLATKRIGVVGLSVGKSVSLTLATERVCGELRVADFDRLSLSNLNRLTAGTHAIDWAKTEVTAREIAEIDPYLRVVRFDAGVTKESLDTFLLEGGKLDLVIDECDDLMVKVLLRLRARALGIPVLMDTSDRGLLDVERFDLEPGRPIFHGMVGDLDPARLEGLSTEDKIPIIADILGRQALSSRMVASMVEIGATIRTWPQLASSVVLGGALACDTARRILLGQLQCSGRFYVDFDRLVSPSTGAMHEPAARIPVARQTSRLHAPRVPRGPLTPIVEAATRAPSGGNMQPWRFVASRDQLWVLHDRARSTSFLDFEDYAAMASLGAAVENAVLAAHAAGMTVAVTAFPEGAPREHAVARLDFGGRSTEPHGFDPLAASIVERHTNRRLGERRPLPQGVRSALEVAGASAPGARLQIVDDPAALDEMGAILGAGDRLRLLNRRLHDEMMGEIRWSVAEAQATGDGIDLESLELSALDRVGIEMSRAWEPMGLLDELGLGSSLEKASRKAVAASVALGLVTVEGDSRRAAFFEGGRVMQRVWLAATQHGLAVQPLSSLPYLFARLTRAAVAELGPEGERALRGLRARYERVFSVARNVGVGEVLLLRFAYAPPAATRALRRPLELVLEELEA